MIFSSRKIPGNETKISWILNRLVEKGIEVVTDKNDRIHVSGHPARDELTRMYQMVRPQIAVPTHGEPRHLHEHSKLARKLGVVETVEAHNGAVVLLAQGSAGIVGKVQSGYIAVDGTSLIPTDGEIIRTRRKLRDDGCLLVSLVFGKDGELLHPVMLAAPGVLDPREDKELLDECIAEIAHAVKGKGRGSPEQIKEQVRSMLRKIIKGEMDKKPVIEVHVARV